MANPQLHNGEPPVANPYTSLPFHVVLRNFAWQDGYGAFTVSKSHVLDVIAYIQNQRPHHRGKTFKEEFLSLLERPDIDYDKRDLWD